MSTAELKHLLGEIAEEVKPVQLHQRAVAQARRTVRRTALLAGVAVAVLMAGGVAGVGGLAGAAGPDPAGLDTAGPRAGAPPAGSARLTGRFYGVEFNQSGRDLLLSWRAGDRKLTEVTGSDDPMFSHGTSMSADGRYVSWIDQRGRVHVRELRSGVQRLAGQVDVGTVCAEPVWAPDSRRLLVKVDDDRAFFWDARTAAVTEVVAPRGCQIRVATDAAGRDMLFSVDGVRGDVQVYRSDPAGRQVRTPLAAAARGAGVHVLGLTAVSPDGRLACLRVDTVPGYHQGLGEGASCSMVVEVDSGRVVDVGDGWIGTAAVFDVPGRVLVRMLDGTMPVVLMSLAGEHLDEAAGVARSAQSEPPPLLRYVPESNG